MKGIRLEDLMDNLKKSKIILLGEEHHWNRNIFEKEKEIVTKLADQEENLIVALEYSLSEEGPAKNYIDSMVEFFKTKGKIEGLEPGRDGWRGRRMAEKILMLWKNNPGSKIISIVGSPHIMGCGTEIPAYLKDEFLNNYGESYAINVSRVLLTGNISKENASIEKDILGPYYLF